MFTTAGTRMVPQPPGGQAQPAPPGGKEQAGGLSLVPATALVIGSIIGTGVFTLPAVMAAGGTSSLAVLAVVGIAAMMLAVLFGRLTRRAPNSAGGLVFEKAENRMHTIKAVMVATLGLQPSDGRW